MIIEILLESSLKIPKDKILLEYEEVLLGTSQLEINCLKEYWKKQIKHTVSIHKEVRDTAIKDSE